MIDPEESVKELKQVVEEKVSKRKSYTLYWLFFIILQIVPKVVDKPKVVEKSPIVNEKDDRNMSNPEDKDMYTTR